MKIDEAVATKTPQIIAAVKERITSPPKKIERAERQQRASARS